MDLKTACQIPGILQAANPATQARLLSCARLRRYQKGEQLFLDRMKVQEFYFLIEGIAALYKINMRDEKRVIFVCATGEMINEVILQADFASVNCEILADSSILSFPKKYFLEILREDASLSMAVMESMALKIRRLYHQMKNTAGSVRLDRQIAAKLWKLSRDHGIETSQGTMIAMDLSISYLAQMVGAQRETVSRQVKLLTQKELILVVKKRFIIRDREKLLDYFKET